MSASLPEEVSRREVSLVNYVLDKNVFGGKRSMKIDPKQYKQAIDTLLKSYDTWKTDAHKVDKFVDLVVSADRCHAADEGTDHKVAFIFQNLYQRSGKMAKKLPMPTCVIHIEGTAEEIHIPEKVLRLQSAKFQKLLSHLDKKSGARELFLKTNEHYNSDALKVLLNYIATGDLPTIDASNALPLLCLAEEYQVPMLPQLCATVLIKTMDPATERYQELNELLKQSMLEQKPDQTAAVLKRITQTLKDVLVNNNASKNGSDGGFGRAAAMAAIAEGKIEQVRHPRMTFKIETADGEVFLSKRERDILKVESPFFEAFFRSGGAMKGGTASLELKNYSKATVEYFIRCTHSRSAPLPPLRDADAVRELILLAGFLGYSPVKLEQAVTTFFRDHHRVVLEDANEWMNLLTMPHPPCLELLLAHGKEVITPHLLNHLGIQHTESVSPESGKKTFEIASDDGICLFSNTWGPILQQLPVPLAIKNSQDLNAFKELVKALPKEADSPRSFKFTFHDLPFALDLSEADVKDLEEFAIKHRLKIELTHASADLKDVSFFGKEQWETHFGTVGEVPPLPANTGAVLSSRSRLFPGKTVKDTHMLVLIPATVNGAPFHLNSFRQLVKHPLQGHAVKITCPCEIVLDTHGNRSPKDSYWALMPKELFPGSRGLSYQAQKQLVEPQGEDSTYNVTDTLSLLVGVLTHYVRTGERLITGVDSSYARCREVVDNLQVIVGNDSSKGFLLSYYYNHSVRVTGIGAQRNVHFGQWSLED